MGVPILNELENEMYLMLLKVLNVLTARTIGHQAYRQLLGEVRDICRKIENIEEGCGKGIHSTACDCGRRVA